MCRCRCRWRRTSGRRRAGGRQQQHENRGSSARGPLTECSKQAGSQTRLRLTRQLSGINAVGPWAHGPLQDGDEHREHCVDHKIKLMQRNPTLTMLDSYMLPAQRCQHRLDHLSRSRCSVARVAARPASLSAWRAFERMAGRQIHVDDAQTSSSSLAILVLLVTTPCPSSCS